MLHHTRAERTGSQTRKQRTRSALHDRYRLQEVEEQEPEPEPEQMSLYEDSTAFASAQPGAPAPPGEKAEEKSAVKKRTGKRKRDAAAAEEAPESKKNTSEAKACVSFAVIA